MILSITTTIFQRVFLICLLIYFSSLCFIPYQGMAQKKPDKPLINRPPISDSGDSAQRKSQRIVNVNKDPNVIIAPDFLTDRNFKLSVGILVFGFAIIIVISVLVLKSRIESDILMKIVTVVVASTSSLFLVVAGYSTEQIAPAFGLLGTLVGYLLGQKDSEKNKEGK
jgi:hypothetical protein